MSARYRDSPGEPIAEGTHARVDSRPTSGVHSVATVTHASANLDLLRCMAAGFVVVFHLLLFFRLTVPPWDASPLGHWGVLMFFVHTSLVLMLSLERQARRSPGAELFGEFVLRRCFRLLPLATLVVLVVVVLSLPVGHLRAGSFKLVALGMPGVMTNLLMIQNLTHTDSVLATLWSLPYEMQMYLTLPALFLFATRRRARALLVLWVVCALLAFGWGHIDVEQRFDFPQYVPCFLAGVCAYRLQSVTGRTWPAWLWPIVLVAMTLLYLAHPSPSAGMLDCLVLGLLLPRFRELEGKRLRQCLQHIARYSYGLYLVHFIGIWFAFAALSRLPIATRWLVFLGVTFGVPVVLYHTVEAPMIALGERTARWLHREK